MTEAVHSSGRLRWLPRRGVHTSLKVVGPLASGLFKRKLCPVRLSGDVLML